MEVPNIRETLTVRSFESFGEDKPLERSGEPKYYHIVFVDVHFECQ